MDNTLRAILALLTLFLALAFLIAWRVDVSNENAEKERHLQFNNYCNSMCRPLGVESISFSSETCTCRK